MKFKKLGIISIIITGLVLPNLVFGAISYSRDPAGYSITSPVSFFVSGDIIEDIVGYPAEDYSEWRIGVMDTAEQKYYSPIYSMETLSVSPQISLPEGFIATVVGVWVNHIEVGWVGPIDLEYDAGSPIFEIVAPPEPFCGNDIKENGEVCDGTDLNGETCISQGFESGTLACNVGCLSFDTSACVSFPPAFNILPMETDFPFSTLAYAGQLFTDLSPYLLVILGLPLAFWVIKSIILINKKKKGRHFQ